jgi:hypothetical protein
MSNGVHSKPAWLAPHLFLVLRMDSPIGHPQQARMASAAPLPGAPDGGLQEPEALDVGIWGLPVATTGARGNRGRDESGTDINRPTDWKGQTLKW